MHFRRNNTNSTFRTYSGISFLIVKSLAKILKDLAFAVCLFSISLQLIKLCIEVNHLSKGIQRQELVLLPRFNGDFYPLSRSISKWELLSRLIKGFETLIILDHKIKKIVILFRNAVYQC